MSPAPTVSSVADQVGSLPKYLYDKCERRIKENIAYFSRIWRNPDSLITADCSGALVDAVTGPGAMGALGALAKEYATQNSDLLIMGAMSAAGNAKFLGDAFNYFQDLLAAALMAQNNLVFRMVKENAWACMEATAAKDEKVMALGEEIKAMYAALASLVGAPDYWDIYTRQLREALRLVAGTRTDLKLVFDTFSRQDYWLTKKFDDTVAKLEKAKDLITPKKNNPAVQRLTEGAYAIDRKYGTPPPNRKNPEKSSQTAAERLTEVSKGFSQMGDGLAIFGAGLSDNFPFPTSGQAWQASLAIAKISKRAITALKGYLEATRKVNLHVAAFKAALGLLNLKLPGFLKHYILKLMQPTYDRVNTLAHSMALILNGDENAVNGPITMINPYIPNGAQELYKPNSLDLTVHGFKWVSDINLILQGYKMLPRKFLDQMALDRGAADKYTSIVASLNKMYPGGKIGSSMGELSMTGAQEEIGQLETQVLAFVMEANNAVISSTVRKGILSLAKALLGRLELTIKADHDIYALMDEWYNYPLPNNAELDKLYNGLTGMLKGAGLDRALSAMVTGDYNTLFSMNGFLCTHVGGALAALALLEMCDLSRNEKDLLDELKNELNADMDLFNFNFSINFDFAIFKNILECLRLTDLMNILQLKELLCGFVRQLADGVIANASKLRDKMEDAYNSAMEDE
jgi:hypothetical protein